MATDNLQWPAMTQSQRRKLAMPNHPYTVCCFSLESVWRVSLAWQFSSITSCNFSHRFHQISKVAELQQSYWIHSLWMLTVHLRLEGCEKTVLLTRQMIVFERSSLVSRLAEAAKVGVLDAWLARLKWLAYFKTPSLVTHGDKSSAEMQGAAIQSIECPHACSFLFSFQPHETVLWWFHKAMAVHINLLTFGIGRSSFWPSYRTHRWLVRHYCTWSRRQDPFACQE